MQQVGLRHRHERPALEVLPLDGRIEENGRPPAIQTPSELDVLHERDVLVEATELDEEIAANRSEPSPERGRQAGALLMDVVVEQVPELRYEPVGIGVVVIRTENRCECRILVERSPDPLERVGVDLDVGIDEHENVSGCSTCSTIARSGSPEAHRLVHHDELVGGGLRPPYGGGDALDGWAPV